MTGNSRLVAVGSWAGVILLLASLHEPAQAQLPANIYNPARQPPVSPYLNLLRSGTNPAISYYGIVRPEIAFRNNLQQLEQQQQQTVVQQQDLAGALTLPATGHTTGFMTQSKYFMSKGGQVGGAAPVALPKAVTPAPKRGGIRP